MKMIISSKAVEKYQLSIEVDYSLLNNLFKSINVLPTRFELISMVPETIILSIELREQGCKYRI